VHVCRWESLDTHCRSVLKCFWRRDFRGCALDTSGSTQYFWAGFCDLTAAEVYIAEWHIKNIKSVGKCYCVGDVINLYALRVSDNPHGLRNDKHHFKRPGRRTHIVGQLRAKWGTQYKFGRTKNRNSTNNYFFHIYARILISCTLYY